MDEYIANYFPTGLIGPPLHHIISSQYGIQDKE